MPHHKAVALLQELCVDLISRILQTINTDKHFNAQLWNYNLAESPFRCFPDSIIQNLINETCLKLQKSKTNFLHKNVFELLVCRSLEYLDLNCVKFQDVDWPFIINHLLNHCSRLRYFSVLIEGWIPSCCNFPVRQAMIKLVNNLTNIKELYIHGICFDELLEAIGESCNDIQVLLIHSEHITDNGLLSLCVDSSGTIPRCRKLRKISIDYEADGISMGGIKVLLEHLPLLVELEGWKIGHVLEQIYGSTADNLGRCYNLQQFSYDWRKCSSGDSMLAVKIAFVTCPYITCLKLVEPTNDALRTLSALNHLTSITIITYARQVTFESSVGDLLKQVGHQVKRLSLSMHKIDLSIIDLFCPNLQCLECSYVEEIQQNVKPSNNPFENLQDLVFHARQKTVLSTSDLRLLLFNSYKLQNLSISCCNSWTDEMLQRILSCNPLNDLTSLYLFKVDNFTEVGVRLLIGRKSNLKSIILFDSAGVYRATLDNLKQQIQAANLDLKINDS